MRILAFRTVIGDYLSCLHIKKCLHDMLFLVVIVVFKALLFRDIFAWHCEGALVVVVVTAFAVVIAAVVVVVDIYCLFLS